MSTQDLDFDNHKILPLLTREEEKTLAIARKRGDLNAINTFILRNQGLVIKYANSYYSRHSNLGLSLTDLVQEGNLGLREAAKAFDDCRGTKFSTFAAWWVKQKIRRAISDNKSSIVVPGHVQDTDNFVRRVRQDLKQELGFSPTEAEVKERLMLIKKTKSVALDLSRPTGKYKKKFVRSYYETDHKGHKHSIFLHSLVDHAVFPAEFKMLAKESCDELTTNINQLIDVVRFFAPCQRDSEIFFLRYGLAGYRLLPTLEKISQCCSGSRLTKERVRQIINYLWKYVAFAQMTICDKTKLFETLEKLATLQGYIVDDNDLDLPPSVEKGS